MDAGGWWKNNGKKRFFCECEGLPAKILRVGLIYVDVCFVLDFFWSSDKMTPNKNSEPFNLNELYHHFPSLDFILPISNLPKLNSEIRWLLRPRWVMGEMPHNGCSHWRQPSGRLKEFGCQRWCPSSYCLQGSYSGERFFKIQDIYIPKMAIFERRYHLQNIILGYPC